MPRYLVRIVAKDKRTGRRKYLYGVYSTIVSDWITEFTPSLKELREKYPSLKQMRPRSFKKIFGKKAEAILDGNELVLKYPLYELVPAKYAGKNIIIRQWKSRKGGRKRKSRKKKKKRGR